MDLQGDGACCFVGGEEGGGVCGRGCRVDFVGDCVRQWVWLEDEGCALLWVLLF